MHTQLDPIVTNIAPGLMTGNWLSTMYPANHRCYLTINSLGLSQFIVSNIVKFTRLDFASLSLSYFSDLCFYRSYNLLLL